MSSCTTAATSQPPSEKKQIRIRPATPDDAERILELIHELAVYEKAPEEVKNTKSQLLEDGWGAHPRFIAFMVELDGISAPVGFALCYFAYSTWKGTCLYLEDLYVQEAHRGSGVGMALIHNCVREAKKRNCKRVMWQALDWNAPALAFYQHLGATETREWVPIRLEEPGIDTFLGKFQQTYTVADE